MSDTSTPQQHSDPVVTALTADDDDTAGHLMVRTDETVTPDKDQQDASRRA